tara:strand:+ start:281 stop:745 length:465 start_codon:yes stop_codon:yes gene_type:complete
MKLFEVVKTSNKFMKTLASDIIDIIQLDASRGKFQNGKSGRQYRSEAYKKYKARGMTSLRTGKKLKAFENQSTDTETAFVNMKLTGRTFRGMRASSRKNTGIITYDRGEIVLGNQKRYDIYDLTLSNKLKVMRDVEKLYEKNIKKYTSKDIVIK